MKSLSQLVSDMRSARARLEKVFGPDTAYPGTVSSIPSAGHCAVTALWVERHYGGFIISTKVDGHSRWYNQFVTANGVVEVDLTGDQYGEPAVNISFPGGYLYDPQHRKRFWGDVSDETISRYKLLAERLSQV